MTDYTAGPWKRDGWSIVGEDGSMVAKILPWDVSGCRSEDHSNANLIASAPELLEVAKLAIAMDSPEDMAALFDLATKAIAKVKGD